jgi:hypothetical protein
VLDNTRIACAASPVHSLTLTGSHNEGTLRICPPNVIFVGLEVPQELPTRSILCHAFDDIERDCAGLVWAAPTLLWVPIMRGQL